MELSDKCCLQNRQKEKERKKERDAGGESIYSQDILSNSWLSVDLGAVLSGLSHRFLICEAEENLLSETMNERFSAKGALGKKSVAS